MKIKWLLTLALGLGLLIGVLQLASAAGSAAPSQTSPDREEWPPTTARAAVNWSSGWVAINRGQTLTFTHNLGGDPNSYAVELWFRDTNDGYGINRRNYGGLETGGNWLGAHWQRLTANTVQVYRQPNDNAADQVRIRVWIPADAPDYDSGWVNINQAQTLTITHNLAAAPDDLSVTLWFSGAVRGIHHYAYGSMIVDAPPAILGAFWHNLANNTVQVTRQGNDTDVEQVRVVVSRSDPPSYDSGWRNVPRGLFTFTHNLNQDPSTLLVRGECYTSTLGIHQRYAGGDHSMIMGWQGANVQNLTANTIVAARRANDIHCPQMRMRIWAVVSNTIYLPTVVNNAPLAAEQELAYDDGSAESNQSWDQLNAGFAVRFTSPGASARLVRARYYLNTAQAGHPIEVHVWDVNHNDLIAPFAATPPAGEGWFNVDLSSYNLTVSGDFYVGFLYAAQHSDPSVGVDDSAPDGRSYEVPWSAYANDYMIRAVVVP